MPVYNETANMEAIEERLGTFLPQSALKACVLMIDDGSTDDSLKKMKDICGRNPSFYYMAMNKNGGLSAAMKAGIDAARSPYVAYIDADLQTAPEDFNLLYPLLKDNALVMGIRANRKDSGFKKMQSKIANSFRRAMTGDTARDTGCPLKVMRTDYARRIPFFTGMHRFLPALISLQGGTYAQVPVRHFPRVAGESKYHLANRLVGPFMDCFALRWMKKRYINNSAAESNI